MGKNGWNVKLAVGEVLTWTARNVTALGARKMTLFENGVHR